MRASKRIASVFRERTKYRNTFLLLFLFGLAAGVMAQNFLREPQFMGMAQLPSSAAPPVIAAPVMTNNQTLSQFRVNLAKGFIQRARVPEYRFVDNQMYDLEPLADFLLWVADLPVTAENTAMLKTKTRPLANWSLIHGRVAQVTDRNGILLWKYEQPEMVSNPKLVRLLNYPAEKTLVDGDIVIVFAKNEGPYSYLDSSRNRSTVNSFDFGKPATRQEVDKFIQSRPLPTIHLPPKTNHVAAQQKP
jgi:hypothetical protein